MILMLRVMENSMHRYEMKKEIRQTEVKEWRTHALAHVHKHILTIRQLAQLRTVVKYY